MTWKVFTFFGLALLALSEARPPISEQKVSIETLEKLSHIGSHKPEHHEVYAWAYPSYEFKYEVDDPHTHDFKGHEETRKGDEVKGHYWLVQPDGYKRTVKYHVDKNSGFKAHVDYIKLHDKMSEENEENGGEEENSNEGGDSNDNGDDGSDENISNEEALVASEAESSNDNEGESANLDGHSEQESNHGHGRDRDMWKRGDIKFGGRRRGRDEYHKNHKNNNEESEQEAIGSDNINSGEEQASEENESIHHDKVEEQSSGADSGNDGSSAVENKSEKHVKKHEYHVIIHHPKYISTSHKKHGY